jgi:Mg-chelatase subunit ChlD
VPDFHGIPITAKDVVFVIDVSGSIGSTGFESAKGATVRAMERLGSDVHVAALFFDEIVHPWHPETVLATPENKAELAAFVRGIPRGKRTDVMTPLNAGLQVVRNRVEARRAAKETNVPRVEMFVVSDGLENARATPGEAVGDKLDRLDLSQAVVHAVVVGGRDNALMAALARRGGGRYVVLP